MEVLINNYSIEYPNYYLQNTLTNNLINETKYFNDDEKDKFTHFVKFLKNYHSIKSFLTNSGIIKSYTPKRELLNSLIKLVDGRILASFSQSIIQILSIDDKYNIHCDIEINENEPKSFTYISQLKNGKIITCKKRSIKIWNLDKTSCVNEKTIDNAHLDNITKLIPLSNNRMASCSYDKTIKIWSSESPYSLLGTLRGHEKNISSIIQVEGQERLISTHVSLDTIFVFNLLSFQKECSIENIKCSSSNCIKQVGNMMLFGSGSCVYVLNVINYLVEKIICNNKMECALCFLQLRDENVLIGCGRGKLFIYDMSQNEIVEKETKLFNDSVYSLVEINEELIANPCGDNKIYIWNY